MEKTPDLNVCTAEEYADWLQHVKEEQGVVVYVNGFYTDKQIYTLVEAFRIMGYREGYKRGKRDGSYAGYRVGYDKGFEDGYSSCTQESYEEFCDLRWRE